MRVKKASINVIVNFITYFLSFIPVFLVRRVFNSTLGAEILGLNTIYTNIIGLLSIVELGIGTAIVYALYKPYAEDDKSKVKAYMDFYAKFYRSVGIVVLVVGLAIIPVLRFFVKDQIDMMQVNVCYILFLSNTVMSYFFSYKTTMLYVAQEGYKVSTLNTIAKVAIALIQIGLLRVYPSFELYLVVQILINGIYYIYINRYVDKSYPWLKDVEGTLVDEEKKSLTKNMKALFLHKVGGLAVLSTDNLIITAFLDMKIAAYVGSYSMVITSAQSVIVSTLSGVTASIGNLLTENNDESSYIVHKRLFFMNFWVASFVAISIFNAIDQFVVLWMGAEQLLDTFTVAILLINFYFILMRSSTDSFKEAGGIYYQDRYSPLFEGAINLIASIILIKLIGLPGVFLGTLISNFSVVFWVKPKMAYKYIFKKPLREYFKTYFKYTLIAFLVLILSRVVSTPFREQYTISAFIINCIVNIVVINLSYILIFIRNDEFKYFKNIAFKILKVKRSI